MTVDTKTQDADQPTATLPVPEEDQAFNWKNCWYPIAFLQDLPKNRPYSFSLYDEPFVLFTDQQCQLVCLIDRCPHRAAKLSEGQIIDGKIECLYHGWQFGSDGECLHIPQLPAETKIPANACVQSFKVVERQGMIWMWRGEREAADIDRILTLNALDKAEFVSTDHMCDLPYDQTYFIENVIDPVHIHISHHGTLGNRADAQPIEMEVIKSSDKGIRGRLRGTRKPNQPWGQMDFFAPNLVVYSFSIEQRGWSGGTALYSIPLGKERCRILARNYRNFLTWQVKLKPRWLDHWHRNRILEEDLQLVVGQKAQIERLGQNPKELYLPIKTSDTFVIEYRKWLDKFGQSLPFYQGYSTFKRADDNSEWNQTTVSLDRFSRHTQLCSSCKRAYQITNRLKQTLVGVAIGMAVLAIITDSFGNQIGAVSASLLAVALAVVAEKVKTKFERSYTRH